MMPRPFILWAATRTSSTNLAQAVKAENEPFQAGPPPSRLAWSYARWQRTRDTGPLSDLCADGVCFKHIPEAFDDAFNIAIAQASMARNYCHLHLIRLDELSRLVSLDVAGQLDAWTPGPAAERFAELHANNRSLSPLDVPRLVSNAWRVWAAWKALEPHLAPVLTVFCERLTSPNIEVRQTSLRRIAGFLELPEDSLLDLELAMRDGGQHTARVRERVPNVGELRSRLMEEGFL